MTTLPVWSRMRRDQTFLDDPAPMMVLDDDLVFRVTNSAYQQMTQRSEDELTGRALFDVFPDNPSDPEGGGGSHIVSSTDRVLRTGRAHHMLVLRHDLPSLADPEVFETCYWVPVLHPVPGDRRTVGVISRVVRTAEPSSEVREVVRQVHAALEATPDEATPPPELVDAIVRGLHHMGALEGEVAQLRRALTSRSTIDQAKGMVMARWGVGPEQSFELLKRISSTSNVRVADLAASLVEQASRGEHPELLGPEADLLTDG